jgi:hypothetical protein
MSDNQIIEEAEAVAYNVALDYEDWVNEVRFT